MGWDSASDWHSKADVVADSIREYAIREHSVVGNHLWGVIDTTSVGKIVVLILIDGRGGSWSRKAISEDMGPCYYDCPDKVLRAATGNPNREWRAKVSAAKSAKKQVFMAGSKVKVAGSGALYTIEGRHNASSWVIVDDAGKRYRCTTARLTAI